MVKLEPMPRNRMSKIVLSRKLARKGNAEYKTITANLQIESHGNQRLENLKPKSTTTLLDPVYIALGIPMPTVFE